MALETRPMTDITNCHNTEVDITRRTPSPPFVTSAGEEIDSPPDVKCRKASNSSEKPPYSYIALISMAILEHPQRKMMLGDIYSYITTKFSFYRNATDRAWRNSIRHNLSLNECFMKSGRADNGKGNYWSIHPACVEDFKKGDFRRRQARRRARRSQQTSDINALPLSYRYALGFVPMTNNMSSSTKASSRTSRAHHPYKSYASPSYQTQTSYQDLVNDKSLSMWSSPYQMNLLTPNTPTMNQISSPSLYPSPSAHSPYPMLPGSSYHALQYQPQMNIASSPETDLMSSPPSPVLSPSCTYTSPTSQPTNAFTYPNTTAYSTSPIQPAAAASPYSTSHVQPSSTPSPTPACQYSTPSYSTPVFNPYNPYNLPMYGLQSNNKDMAALKDALGYGQSHSS